MTTRSFTTPAVRFAAIATIVGAGAGVTLAVLASPVLGAFSPSPRQTLTSEAVLRAGALYLPRPVCLPNAIAAGTVVVSVAEVQVLSSGRVLNVDVLDPDGGPLQKAMTHAASQSRFKPLQLVNGRPEVMTAKLTYYFKGRDDGCDVLEPHRAGYVGRPVNTRDDLHRP